MNRKAIIKHLMFIGSFLVTEMFIFGYSLLFTSIIPIHPLVDNVGFIPSLLTWMIFLHLAILQMYLSKEEKERKRGY